MPLKDLFIAELKQESSLTKKMLENVPMNKAAWKPHEKSMTLGRLATHVADIPHWVSDVINLDEFDFTNPKHYQQSGTAAAHEELMKKFQDRLDQAIADLEKMTDEDFNKAWIVKAGEKIMYNTPKSVAVRWWGYSHLFHHRGQLSVYLRLLDVPVPGMYGPSADER